MNRDFTEEEILRNNKYIKRHKPLGITYINECFILIGWVRIDVRISVSEEVDRRVLTYTIEGYLHILLVEIGKNFGK